VIRERLKAAMVAACAVVAASLLVVTGASAKFRGEPNSKLQKELTAILLPAPADRVRPQRAARVHARVVPGQGSQLISKQITQAQARAVCRALR
jgi:hypothetical protein